MVPAICFIVGGTGEALVEIISKMGFKWMSTRMHVSMDMFVITAGIASALYVKGYVRDHAAPVWHSLFWIPLGVAFNMHRQFTPFLLVSHHAMGYCFTGAGLSLLGEYVAICVRRSFENRCDDERERTLPRGPRHSPDPDLPFPALAGYCLMLAGWLSISMANMFADLNPMVRAHFKQTAGMDAQEDDPFWIALGADLASAHTNLIVGILANALICLAISIFLPLVNL